MDRFDRNKKDMNFGGIDRRNLRRQRAFDPNHKPAPKPRRKQKNRPVAKRCVVIDVSTGEAMFYSKPDKALMSPLVTNGSYTEFPSKKKARSAVWHHVMQSGIPMSHTQWMIREV